MLYDDLFSYSQSGVSYSGGLELGIPTVSSPISAGIPGVVFVSEIDHNNYSTVGVVSIDYVASSIVVIETTQSKPSAITYLATQSRLSATTYIEYLN